MTLISIKQLNTQKGFTVTELIIVIVVIAILASIMLVSYANIQNESKAELAKTNAGSVKNVAEAYYDANNVYPRTVSQFSSSFVTMPSNIVLLSSANPTLNASTGENLVAYKYVPIASSSPTGACIYYWDFTVNARSEVTFLGTATSTNCGISSSLGSAPTP